MVLNVRMTVRSKPGGPDLAFNVRRFGQKLTAKERYAIQIWANTVIKSARENLKESRETGELEDSIGNPSKGGILSVSPKHFSAIVGTTVKHAPNVNYGTKSHVIKAKKKALKFKGKDGKVVFRKKVMHPGMEGTFFMDRAVNAANRVLIITLKQDVKI